MLAVFLCIFNVLLLSNYNLISANSSLKDATMTVALCIVLAVINQYRGLFRKSVN
jgi:hypothetical protein